MEARNWRSLVRTARNLSDEDRRRLLDEIYHTIQNWRGPLPTDADLLRHLRPEQIECFLSHVVIDMHGNEESRKRFIHFVAETGYTDDPGVAPNGQYQQVLRTTPIHLALLISNEITLNEFDDWNDMVRLLFRIYSRLDLNYVDERGLTHFHAAFCLVDNHLLVSMYLANGQDPNITMEGYSLIRHAMFNNDMQLVTDLLTNRGDPTRIDEDGSTALHMFCQNDQENLVNMFLEEVVRTPRIVQVNEYDQSGNTPLHLAACYCGPKTIVNLLRLGADPNRIDRDGCNALHLICKRERPYRLLITFFKTCREIGRQVDINATNNDGRTPLNLLCRLHSGKQCKAMEFLQNLGARH